MLQPGTQIGRYEIQRRVGRGGMGTVYVAHDPVLGRMVAIKMFLGDLDLPDAADRFAREARSAAALSHANIVTVHDFGDFASQPYLVMEYVQGETLAEIIRRKAPVPLAEKMRWIEELCTGVAYAHKVGVIHRDIKPTNLMVDRSGRLKVLDFGIARMLGTLASNATALIGTPGYMAPEQILGGTIDFRSDIFSIGVVCYELLSYTVAFPGDTVPTITHRILSEDPAPLTQLVPEINPELVAIVERALKKTVAERFPDTESLVASISRLRRQIENESVWDAPTRPSAPLVPGGPGRPGTDSVRKLSQAPASASAMTPPPDPSRSGREDLIRRRTAQIDAALEQSRALLERGEVDAALEACVQALTLDEMHPGALEVEQAIKVAAARQRAAALLGEARDELGKGALTAAQGLLEQARALDADATDVKRLERDLRLGRVEQERLRQRAETVKKAVESGAQALSRGETEAALAFARQALELDPSAEKACELEQQAMRRLDEETGGGTPAESSEIDNVPTMLATMAPSSAATAPTIIAPAKARAATPSVAAKAPASPPSVKVPAGGPRAEAPPRPGTSFSQRASEAISGVIAGAQAAVGKRSKREVMMIGAGIATGILLAIAGVGVFVTRGGPVPTGTLIIDAVPWANITAIEAEDGTAQALPTLASTPLAFDIPAGTYRVHLAGPPPEAEPQIVTVQVQENAVTVMPQVKFRMLTAEDYFERYLTVPSGESPAAAGSLDTVDAQQVPTPETAR